jgi:hypothetical protein
MIKDAQRVFDNETFTRKEGWKERARAAADRIIGYTDTLSCFEKGGD